MSYAKNVTLVTNRKVSS